MQKGEMQGKVDTVTGEAGAFTSLQVEAKPAINVR